ncbi:MAG: ribonuclease HII [Candidatus Saccharimonadales bacterium]
MILGIDEAGRGPWAGPLVVGAVVLGGAQIEGLTDSKKLTKKKREVLYDEIVMSAQAAATGWVSANELDIVGMSEALRLATRRAVEQIRVPYSEIIIDGTVNFLVDTGKGRYVTTMPKADLLIPSVSAASIMAKVERDRYMTAQDEVYPGYGFASHAGYGVAKHRAAIEEMGVTPLHRLSFAPLQKYRDGTSLASSSISEKSIRSALVAGPVVSSAPKNFSNKLKTFLGAAPRDATRAGVEHETSKKIGDRAEDEAANHLMRLGHDIIARNWKTRYCEIDIVSQKDGTLYFTEVKYRRQPNQGGGLAAITQKKLNQMRYAAKFYAHSKKITDVPLQVSAISLTGEPPSVEEYLEEVS